MKISPIINEKTNIGEHLFYIVGNNGPFILWISSLLLLRNKSNYFIFYMFGYLFNILLNQVLKIFIKQPRPSVDSKTFEIAMNQMKKVRNYTNLISYDAVLGMPSGHAQGVFYSTTFIFLVFFTSSNKNKSYLILGFYILIVFITISQRIYYRFHSLNQILVGGLVGTLFAYLVYFMSNSQKKGIMKGRTEENAAF